MADATGDIGALLPHRGVARLLSAVTKVHDREIEGTGTIPAAHPFSAGGQAPAFLGIELGAQAAAAMEALARAGGSGGSGPRIGHLVRIREATLGVDTLPVDTPLRVTARLDGAAPPLAMYLIEVTLNGVPAVSARISTHSAPPDETTDR